MVAQRKIFNVQNLTQKLKDAQALVLADYRGLTVAQMADLRARIKKAGGEFEVVKNRLLGRAAKEAKVEITDKALEGPTAALWTWEEKIEPIKALHQFAEEFGLPKIKFGIFGQEITPLERIKQLATLPSSEELKAKLVGTLKSPTFRLTRTLNSNVSKLILILKAKGGEN
jgi:large subunit ribosomal protein L10